MEATLLAWLYDVAVRAFGLSLFLLLAIDGLFAVVLLAKRDRAIVNRWTSPVLAANLVLASTGIGVPMLALGSGVVVRMVAPLVPNMPHMHVEQDEVAVERPPR